MPQSTVNIKVLIAAGTSAPDAIKAALPGRPVDFARRHGFPRSHVSRCIHAKGKHERVRAALAEELGVEREWLDQLLEQHAKGRAA